MLGEHEIAGSIPVGPTRIDRMRILFLDNNHERQRRFQMHRIGCVVVQALTYEACIKALDEQSPFDQVHLDHDLSEAAEAGRPKLGERTGTDVAKYIAELPIEKRPKQVVLHSYNFDGRTRMARILNDAGIRAIITPYTLLGS